MKSLLIAFFAAALAPAAFAQVASVEPAPAQESQPAAKEDRRPDFHCLRYTGSTITAQRNKRDEQRARGKPIRPRCASAAGRSWSREDLDRTGASDLRSALRMLDPSIH